MPAALLPELPAPTPEKTERPARAARMQDSVLRTAIEQYAVDEARQYHEQRGATEVIPLGKPYDLVVVDLPEMRTP